MSNIRVSVDAKDSAISRINREKENVLQTLNRLEREVRNAQSWWQGKAGVAAIEVFAKFKREMEAGITTTIEDYTSLMSAAVNAQMEADQQIANKLNSM